MPFAVIAGTRGATPAALLPWVLDRTLGEREEHDDREESSEQDEYGDRGEHGERDVLAAGHALLSDAGPVGQTWVVVHHGTRQRVLAYVPGHRRPREISAGAYDVRTLAGRPPRRIEIHHPAPVLALASIACAPPTPPSDEAAVEVLLDAVRSAMALIIFTTEEPFDQADLELLSRLAACVARMAFVIMPSAQVAAEPNAAGDTCDRPCAMAAKRDALAAHLASAEDEPPGRCASLAAARWYRTADAPAAVLALSAWNADVVRGELDAGVTVPHAPVVLADCGSWRAVLDTELRQSHASAVTAVSERCAAMHSRCAGVIGAGRGCCDLPGVLDRELHALSVLATAGVSAATVQVTRQVCEILIGGVPDGVLLEKARQAVLRIAESADEVMPPRALMVTTTGAVAAVSGNAAVDALASCGLGVSGTGLAPISVAVTSSCYHLWRRRDPHSVDQCAAWLTITMRGVEKTVLHEVDRRYEDLRAALEIVATDAVDHGFLLT